MQSRSFRVFEVPRWNLNTDSNFFRGCSSMFDDDGDELKVTELGQEKKKRNIV
jgi:hypothetical protein